MVVECSRCEWTSGDLDPATAAIEGRLHDAVCRGGKSWQMDDDPARPWNRAEWAMVPVVRASSTSGRSVPWWAVLWTVWLAVSSLTVLGVCGWLLAWAILGE